MDIEEVTMGQEVVLFSSEERRDRTSVAAFLRELANKVESGQVVLQQGSQEIPLVIPEQVVLEIKAEEEDKKGRMKRSLEVEIEWMEGDESGGPVSLG
jgi:amphi-Trp domain-containing protein